MIEGAFGDFTSYIDHGVTDPHSEIVTVGGFGDSKGFFSALTAEVTTNPCMLMA